jgi:hypothetical protein
MVRCDQCMPEHEADAAQTAGRLALTQRLRILSPLRRTAHVAKIRRDRSHLCGLPIRHNKSCARSRTFFRARCLPGIQQVCLLLLRNQAAGWHWPGGDISQTTLQPGRQELDRNHRYLSAEARKSLAYTMFFILIVALAFGLALLGPDEPGANALHFLWR